MQTDIQTLRASFRRLSARGDDVAQLFYDMLFARHPEVVPLFRGVDLDDQKKKLVRSLALVVGHIEQPEFLHAYLKGLGAIHRAYGVAEEHYRGVCDCLLAALAGAGGADWSPAEEQAWREALDRIAETMVAGATALGPASSGLGPREPASRGR